MVKQRGTDWWTPPEGTPLNAAVFYVVQIVDDGLSVTERTVWHHIKLPANKLKNDTGDRGELCDPGGYTRIAKAIGMCRKTIYNAIKGLKRKGCLREFRLIMKGKQRERTIYYSSHYGDVLPMWRADPALFHTAVDNRIVAVGRRKQHVTVERAAEWKIDPRRAPLQGSGRGRSEYVQAQPATPVPAPEPLPSDEDIAVVHAQFKLCAAATIGDAVAVLRAARREAPAITAPIVAAILAQLAGEYKPTSEYPRPTPGWFIKSKMAGKAAEWAHFASPPPGKFEARYRGQVLGSFDTQEEAERAIQNAQQRTRAG